MLPARSSTTGSSRRSPSPTARRSQRLWRTVGDDFDLGWSRIGAAVFARRRRADAGRATGLAYVPAVLAEQGIDPAAVAQVDPARFAGGTSEGDAGRVPPRRAPIKAKVAMARPEHAAALLSAGVADSRSPSTRSGTRTATRPPRR
jgi:hypothetical protein